MLLVIPVVEIKGGRCVQMVQGHEGFVYSDDPMEMVKLWRKENAKTLHITDVDGALEGHPVSHEMIARMVRTVDIPIELSGGLRTFDDVRRAFDEVGVYRVVLGTMFIRNPDQAKRAIDSYGPNKVIVGIDEYGGHVKVNGWTEDSGLLAISAALNAKALGFRRVVYSDITAHGMLRSPNFDFLRQLAEAAHLHITASGGIAGLEDLLKMQELEPLGVDSVLIGRALYANKFACQHIWRRCEAGDFPYTARV